MNTNITSRTREDEKSNHLMASFFIKASSHALNGEGNQPTRLQLVS